MIDYWALVFLVLFGFLAAVLRRYSSFFYEPHMKFSATSLLKQEGRSWKKRGEFLPYFLHLAALGAFSLAFLDPHFYVKKEEDKKPAKEFKQTSVPHEGIAIYLVLDKSGSMSQEVAARDSQGRVQRMAKMDLLRQVTRRFIQGDEALGLKGRGSDLIGLVAFARGADVLAPLTLDHSFVLDELSNLDYTRDLEQDGTAIGYAIYKTASMIAATERFAKELSDGGKGPYEIKSRVMIVVTDGFQSPNPLDQGKRLRNIELVEAAEFARQHGIKLYVINVEPRLASPEFSLHRKLLEQIASLTGGKFFLTDSHLGLDKIYREIDALEKSALPTPPQLLELPKKFQPEQYRRISLYPYLIALGMAAFAAGLFMELCVMRKIP